MSGVGVDLLRDFVGALGQTGGKLGQDSGIDTNAVHFQFGQYRGERKIDFVVDAPQFLGIDLPIQELKDRERRLGLLFRRRIQLTIEKALRQSFRRAASRTTISGGMRKTAANAVPMRFTRTRHKPRIAE